MILIIGYGNPLRRDDGIGYEAAQRLMELIHDPHVVILARHQLTPDLIALISIADTVFFIDARRGDYPGEIYCEEVLPFGSGGVFTHHVSPAVLLESSRILYGTCPFAWLYTMCGAQFELGMEFSAAVQHALPRLVEQLLTQILFITAVSH
jgi:hydrogenase maturation protease